MEEKVEGIYVFGTGTGKEILKSCIKDITYIRGYIDNDPDKQNTWIDSICVDSVEALQADSVVVISVMNYGKIYSQLVDYGIQPTKIIPFFSEVACDNPVFEQLFDLKRWNQEMDKRRFAEHAEDNFNECLCVIDQLDLDQDELIIVIGDNKEADFFYNEVIKRNDAVRCLFIKEKYNTNMLYEKIAPVIYEYSSKLRVFIIEPYKAIKIKGDLLDLGIDKEVVRIIGKPLTTGAKLQDIFNPLLGYSWQGDIEGFMKFGSSKGNGIRIVTLGGSATDATLYNIKSYSEWLHEMLAAMGTEAEIFCGGVAGYVVSQELQKLCCDVIGLKPDIVISYSGINDAADFYTTGEHPFIRNYQTDNAVQMIHSGKLKNTLFGNAKIQAVGLGLNYKGTKAKFWIDCERMMHAVCNEFGISFFAILQPWNQNSTDYYESCHSFYNEARADVKDNRYDWMHDFSRLFDKDPDVFIDCCHVYERGNKKVARQILPYILETIKERNK